MTIGKKFKAPTKTGPRKSVVERNTAETRISIQLTIEGSGQYKVSTGIRFFDHMLELFVRHGAFDLELTCDGDLDVDQHHTVEDVGIALGEAFDRALGDKRGILRAGYFLMPIRDPCDRSRRPERPCGVRRRYKSPHAPGRRPPDRTRGRLFRRILSRSPRQRARQDHVRPVQSSQDRGHIQSVCSRVARGLLPR